MEIVFKFKWPLERKIATVCFKYYITSVYEAKAD